MAHWAGSRRVQKESIFQEESSGSLKKENATGEAAPTKSELRVILESNLWGINSIDALWNRHSVKEIILEDKRNYGAMWCLIKIMLLKYTLKATILAKIFRNRWSFILDCRII